MIRRFRPASSRKVWIQPAIRIECDILGLAPIAGFQHRSLWLKAAGRDRSNRSPFLERIMFSWWLSRFLLMYDVNSQWTISDNMSKSGYTNHSRKVAVRHSLHFNEPSHQHWQARHRMVRKQIRLLDWVSNSRYRFARMRLFCRLCISHAGSGAWFITIHGSNHIIT